MTRPRRFAVLAVVVILVAGCSGAVDQTSPGTPENTVAEAGTTTTAPTTASGTLEVHFINVGQSVSTLIISPEGETMLIDSGHFNNDGEYVLQYLQRHDIERIDHLVTSHNDADHIGGNAAIIEYYETEADGIGAVYDPGIAASTQTYEEYLDVVEQHDVTLYETREGDNLPFAGVNIQVMGPPDPYLASEARNENSIVLKLTHGQTSFLLPGDAEDDQEEYLVEEYGPQLQSTVLKAGHHGSASSSSGAFLDAVNPQATIVSSAYDSRYDHPNEEVLGRLSELSIPAYWTGTHGDIVLVSDGQRVTVRTQQSAPTEPLSLRDGSPIEPGSTDPLEARETFSSDGTVTEAATDTETAVATDGGTATATPSALAVAEIHADAEGDDRENLNDEYVVFENTGDAPLDISGWTISDEADHVYTVPDGTTLDPDASVTLHTGSGEDTESALYWGSGGPVWNNGGDTVTVQTTDGETVLTEEYS